MSEQTYTLTVTLQQAHALAHACEIVARLGMGQFRDALEELPREVTDWDQWHADMDSIGAMLKQHMALGVDGWHRHLGISHTKTSEQAKVSWDLYQVIRRRIAWDKAVADGEVDSLDAPRNWSRMMGVHYDEPLKTSAQPLAVMAPAHNTAKEQ